VCNNATLKSIIYNSRFKFRRSQFWGKSTTSRYES